MRACAGCQYQRPYPHQHATTCPVFAHADVKREADFIICGCGHHSVSYVDHNEHLTDVERRTRQARADNQPQEGT